MKSIKNSKKSIKSSNNLVKNDISLYDIQLTQIKLEEKHLLSMIPDKYTIFQKTYKYNKLREQYLIWRDYHHDDLKILYDMFFDTISQCKRYTCLIEQDIQFDIFSTIIFNDSNYKIIDYQDLYDYMDTTYYNECDECDDNDKYNECDDNDDEYNNEYDECDEYNKYRNIKIENNDFETVKSISKSTHTDDNIIYISDCLTEFKTYFNKYNDENLCNISDDISFDSLYFLCGKLYGFHNQQIQYI